MDGQRLGLLVRALRRKRGWTQEELGRRVAGSQAAISRLERGGVGGVSLGLLARVVSELGGRLKVDILADGENVARLLDADHAAIVELVTRLLADLGWELWPEATFSVFGERGAIDILAFHSPTGCLLVIEVKSVVPDVQATLAGIDRKARLARGLAAERGWHVRSVSRWLVLPDTSTARGRVERHRATFDAALPGRTVALRQWARRPHGPVAGILFVRAGATIGRKHRVARGRGGRGSSGPGPAPPTAHRD